MCRGKMKVQLIVVLLYFFSPLVNTGLIMNFTTTYVSFSSVEHFIIQNMEALKKKNFLNVQSLEVKVIKKLRNIMIHFVMTTLNLSKQSDVLCSQFGFVFVIVPPVPVYFLILVPLHCFQVCMIRMRLTVVNWKFNQYRRCHDISLLYEYFLVRS